MARLSTAPTAPIAMMAAMVVALLVGQVRAQSPSEDALQRAHTHFEAGRALYKLGNFTEAAREFASGYELAPRPGFLINLGQCYIAMHDLPKAREMYLRWLHDAPENDPERKQAEDILHEIERKLAAQPPPAAMPATPSGPEGTRSGETPVPLLSPAPATAIQAQAPPPRRTWMRRNWWIVPVSLVVAGAAVGIGVYFGTRNDPCAGNSVIACFPVTGKGSL